MSDWPSNQELRRGPCKIDQLQNPSKFIASIERIAVQGDSPEQAAVLLVEQLEKRIQRIRTWVLGES